MLSALRSALAIPALPDRRVHYIVILWVVAGFVSVSVIRRRRPAVFAGMRRVWSKDSLAIKAMGGTPHRGSAGRLGPSCVSSFLRNGPCTAGRACAAHSHEDRRYAPSPTTKLRWTCWPARPMSASACADGAGGALASPVPCSVRTLSESLRRAVPRRGTTSMRVSTPAGRHFGVALSPVDASFR